MSVPTFALLLTEYLNRAGISDSELARSIGVRRQTVFRWKEGLVERPRAREDVLRCAAKLRLTTAERDLLLLSAGFAPETLSAEALQGSSSLESVATVVTVAANEGAAETEEPAVGLADEGRGEAQPLSGVPVNEAQPSSAVPVNETQPSSGVPVNETQLPVGVPEKTLPAPLVDWLRQPTKMRLGAVGLLLLLVLLPLLFWRFGPAPGSTIPPIATATVGQAMSVTPLPTSAPFPAIHPTAQPGELLVLIAPFHGYTVNEQYNVAGRLQEALTDEIANAEAMSVTIALWPDEIADGASLNQVLTTSAAALVIWGEYDSGRVRVNLDGISNVAQKRDFPLSSASELNTTISNTLPREIRMLALIALGRLLRNQGDAAAATTAFARALAIGPGDAKTRALLNFYLGKLAERGGALRDLNRAIRYYNDALTENPRLVDARYNLGTVRLNRSYLHPAGDAAIGTDLDAAIDHLSTVIGLRPTYRPAYQNRGVARYERNQGTDLADAVEDFSRVIAADAENSRAYFHRALTAVRSGQGKLWVDDFQQTLALEPTYYPAYNGICWGYALAEQAETALPFCDQAVALDPTGASRDSRGIVYAQMGRYADAAADFAGYLEWLRAEVDPTLYERYRGPVVEEWIAALQQDENPFTPEILDGLR